METRRDGSPCSQGLGVHLYFFLWQRRHHMVACILGEVAQGKGHEETRWGGRGRGRGGGGGGGK